MRPLGAPRRSRLTSRERTTRRALTDRAATHGRWHPPPMLSITPHAVKACCARVDGIGTAEAAREWIRRFVASSQPALMRRGGRGRLRLVSQQFPSHQVVIEPLTSTLAAVITVAPEPVA